MCLPVLLTKPLDMQLLGLADTMRWPNHTSTNTPARQVISSREQRSGGLKMPREDFRKNFLEASGKTLMWADLFNGRRKRDGKTPGNEEEDLFHADSSKVDRTVT